MAAKLGPSVEDEPFRDRPALRGWTRYSLFAESVTTGLRYVRDNLASSFLEDVLVSCEGRKLSISKGRIYWRARLGCEIDNIVYHYGDIDVITPEERPYKESEMKPIPNWQIEGRANSHGIPCLYLATTRDTALSEIRPWIDATISVAELVITRDLNIIDCSKHHAKQSAIEILGDTTRSEADGMWLAIDQAFAKPVSQQETKEYLPTQIIAELFKSKGFDGIWYKSLLSDDGFNLALFNLDDAKVISCGLWKATSIRFDFRSTGKAYFVGDDDGVQSA